MRGVRSAKPVGSDDNVVASDRDAGAESPHPSAVLAVLKLRHEREVRLRAPLNDARVHVRGAGASVLPTGPDDDGVAVDVHAPPEIHVILGQIRAEEAGGPRPRRIAAREDVHRADVDHRGASVVARILLTGADDDIFAADGDGGAEIGVVTGILLVQRSGDRLAVRPGGAGGRSLENVHGAEKSRLTHGILTHDDDVAVDGHVDAEFIGSPGIGL